MDLFTVHDVIAADADAWQPGDRWLAGGTFLFSQPQPRTRRLRDLTALSWPPLRTSQDPAEPGLDIAATCTIAELFRYSPPARWPSLGPLIQGCCHAFLASFKVWNVATVGGNLCAALPAGPMISLVTAAEGSCLLQGLDGRHRRVPAAELVCDVGATVLRPDEYLHTIRLPARTLGGRFTLRRASLRPLGRSASVVIGHRDPDTGAFTLTVTAATRRPVAVALADLPRPGELADLLDARIPAGDWYDDVHGLPAWRRQMTLRLAEQVRAELAGGPAR
ncbi:FAD-binding molybdopterin dehydrogenase [Micromonospora sp. KC207]|uniref:FAD binding domain-containing protein n=1 Tax=Micromonospora sp. KC207 TaxID=2530377 RepID=UPI00105281F0|nr:FAD binding domain-containing protein [Micromonospora sp. KC207]TDC59949.1 FAD-binding molybdopterin dehydrogenase [Micromonospora sp. KC207]